MGYKNNNGTTLYVENDSYLKPLKKRYCGNRLSRSSFILLMFLMVILLLFVLFFLILYLAIIPAMIKLGDHKDGADPMKFSKLNIYGFNDDGFNLEVATVLPPLVPWLPGSMKLLHPVFYIGSATGKYVQLKVPDMDIKLNQPYSLNMLVRIAFVDNPGLKDYIKDVVDDESKPNLVISSDLEVEILRVFWYKCISVEKVVDLNQKSVKSNSSYNGTIPEAIVVENPNALIREKYPEDKRIIMGSNLPDIVWNNFDLKLTDDGINLNFVFEMENPTIARLDIPEINFGIGVNLVDFVRISLSPIVLNHGINEMKLEIGIKFVQLDEHAGQAFGDLLNGNHLTVNGPIALKDAKFAEQISSEFKFALSVSNSSQSLSFPGLPDADEILDKSDISFHVDESGMKIPLSLVLPVLIPLPPKILFPAVVNLAIFGSSAKAIDIIVNPIVIETTKDAIKLTTELMIIPVNSEEAADSLAAAINPIVSLNPSNSSVRVGDFKFSVDNHVLKWSETLMKSEKINIPLKEICISCFFSEKASASSDKYLLQPKGISISQLVEDSGFEISALMDTPKSNKVRFGVNLGYFGLSIRLQRKEFITFDLPSGIYASASKSQMDLKSRLILSHEPSLATNLLATINAVRFGDQSAIIGITDILVGKSEKVSFLTFSRIVIEVDAKIFHDQELPQIGGQSDGSKPFATLNSAALEIESSKKIEIGAGISFSDVPLSLSRAKLDGDELISIALNPLLASPEHKELYLKASVGLASGNPVLADKVASLANQMFSSEFIDDLKFSVLGLVITPPGVSSGPGVIDQFKNLEIPVVLPESNDQSSDASLIDTSPLKHNLKLSLLDIKIERTDLRTIPNSAVSLSANFGYENRLPVKLVLPYIKAEIALNNVSLFEQTITGVDLSNGSGQMSPHAQWYFQQHDTSIQDHVAKLVTEINQKNGVNTKVSVKDIYFGISETDRNDLFSRMKLDISKMLEEMQLPVLDIPFTEENSNSSDIGGYELRRAVFQVFPGKKMALDASVTLKGLAPVTADVGFFRSGVLINDNPLAKVSIRGINGKFGSGTTNLDIGADVLFEENEKTPTEVASIVYAATHDTSLGSALKLTQFGLGFSENDKIETFSKVIFPLPADALLERIKKKKSSDDDVTRNSIDLDLKAKKLDISFEPGSVITASASASATLPYNASISLPYLDARISVDGTYAARSVVQKISISSSEISGGLKIMFQDSDELENKLGSLSETIFKGEKTFEKAGVQGIVFGVSEEDSIKAFSLLNLELPLDVLISHPSSGKKSFMNAVADAYIDAMKIKNVEIETQKGQLMKSSVEVEFNNHLNVTINGLGHLSGNVAIDSEPILETVLSGLHLNHGTNNVLFNADLHFVSSRNSQIQVATLIHDVLRKNQSDLTQKVCGTGLEIGNSAQDYIKAFRKIKVGIQASQLLKKPADDDIKSFNPEKLIENLEIRKNDIDLSEAGAIRIGIELSISNVTLPVTASIGYMGISTKLENADLATVAVNNLIISHDTGNIVVNFDIKVNIPGGDDIKMKVAQTAKNIKDHGIHNTSVSAQLYNIGFGANSKDVIDTFSLVSADINPLSYLPADPPSPKKSNRTVKVDIIYADVLDSRRLSAEVHGRLINFPPVSVNIPYVAISSHMDGEELLEVSISDIMLKEGAISLTSILYTHKNLNAAQKLAQIVGNILFHRPQPPVPNKMNMLSLRFGSSEESAIDILEYISLDTPMADMLDPIDKVQETPDTWIELVEMKSKISATGLDASVVGRPFPDILPFAAKNTEAGATAKIGYGLNGTQTVVKIFFGDLFFTPGKPFTGKADIQVLVPEILPFLQQNVPNLFEWKNYDQNISVGWPVMTIGDPHNPSISFDPFDQIFMDAPPLFLWTPLTFVPKLVNPFKSGLGLDVDIHVPNPGPLYADFGFLTTRMFHKGKEVATITNPRPVIIKNKMNGGELFGTNIITLQVRIHLSSNPFKAWEELSDIIHNFRDYTVDIESSTPEIGRVEWLSTCFQHVPKYMTGQVVPMLISMLAHIKVGPWTITPPERFRRGAQMMLNKLDPEHIKIVSSEVEVDSDHFMAQSRRNTFLGVTDNVQDSDELSDAAIEDIASNVSEQDIGHDILNEEFSFGIDSSVKVH